MEFLEHVRRTGIVPVVVLDRVEDAVPTARALLRGGIDLMEITFRTAAAEDSIRAVSREVPEMTVGAGTVLTVEQAERAVDAGSKFLVAPGLEESVVRWSLEKGIPIVPGCVTPTEIMKALSLGLTTVKFFPANIYGGLAGMKALSAPFGGLTFIPTGGVDGKNLTTYLAEKFIPAVGGSWVCTKDDIRNGRFDRIEALSAEAAAIVAVRG